MIINKNTISRALIGFRFIFILGSRAHKYILQLYKYILFVFSYSGYGLVALFTGVDKHVHYALSAIIYLTPVKTQLLQYKLTRDLMLLYHSDKIKA